MGQTTDLDRWLEISDFSNETLTAVIARLELSDSPRHWILREAELDDLWRYVEAAIDNERRVDPDSPGVRRLEHLFEAVEQAHDLTGEGRVREAALQLRKTLATPMEN